MSVACKRQVRRAPLCAPPRPWRALARRSPSRFRLCVAAPHRTAPHHGLCLPARKSERPSAGTRIDLLIEISTKKSLNLVDCEEVWKDQQDSTAAEAKNLANSGFRRAGRA
ncbi:PREDICTED: uncharacterized protein LOC108775611 [Cyphomyrmex costatus]|uniref:uncharacterized protein LOC108775611 n=1 Tax=Cyphomyrmex costatus TaxID=456900 RepID=UPI0008522D9D|nr:PREDICTED: uncharacterized protein LOC108775611 [Cyphomyrmex costatus]